MTADGLSRSPNLRNVGRCARRIVSRCWRDRETIELPRIFCQNSGACGSTYLVQLLIDNGVERCFHELAPDLNRMGVAHYDNPIDVRRITRVLRYSRHDVFFEASNRLFSFSKELKNAFPNAKFVHLHRHPADAVCSAMSKPNVDEYLKNNLRFQGSLAGDVSQSPFERFCHYWNNVNRRIAIDVGDDCLSLSFTDLVSGYVSSLEKFIGTTLPIRSRPTVNQGTVRAEGRFPECSKWNKPQRDLLNSICGETMQQLGYARLE